MAPNSPVFEVPAHVAEAAKILGGLDLELMRIEDLMERRIAESDPLVIPTTYQVYRFFRGCALEAGVLLDTMLGDAQLAVDTVSPYFKDFDVEGIAAVLDTAEIRVEKCMFGPFKLDDLPPGNPGEKEFERLLKPKIALNRSFTQLMHKLAMMHTAVFSEEYRLDISEETRVIAWRKNRKNKLEGVLRDIELKLVENEAYLKALNDAKAAVLERISGNEQMNFDQEIDPTKTPETGDE
jgi:hypothetical protein